MLSKATLLLILGVIASVLGTSKANVVDVPSQFLYTTDKAINTKNINGCTLTQWGGMDMGGMAGYPWMSTIVCEDGKSFKDSGVNLHGHLRFYLYRGSMEVNKHTIDVIGGAYWVDMGKQVQLEVTGSVYVVGAHFNLVDVPEVTSKNTDSPKLCLLISFAIFNTLLLFERPSSPHLIMPQTNGSMMCEMPSSITALV